MTPPVASTAGRPLAVPERRGRHIMDIERYVCALCPQIHTRAFVIDWVSYIIDVESYFDQYLGFVFEYCSGEGILGSIQGQNGGNCYVDQYLGFVAVAMGFLAQAGV